MFRGYVDKLRKEDFLGNYSKAVSFEYINTVESRVVYGSMGYFSYDFKILRCVFIMKYGIQS